jgi:flagellar hook-associated protein 2
VIYNPENSFADVQQRYNESGLAQRLSDIMKSAVGTMTPKGSLLQIAGIANDRTETDNRLTKQLSTIDEMVKKLQQTLATEQSRYYSQFTALEKVIQQMNMQSSMLFSDYSTSG